MSEVPQWAVRGDWFDVCSCDIPCPCEFAQPPTRNHCQGVLAYHVREGHYGDVSLDGLNLVACGEFEGNAWAGAQVTMALFIDERADQSQREALGAIFGGHAGGWPAVFAAMVVEVRGPEFAPVHVEVPTTCPAGARRFPGASGRWARRCPDRPHRPGRGSNCSTRPDRRSAPGRSRPGGWPP